MGEGLDMKKGMVRAIVVFLAVIGIAACGGDGASNTGSGGQVAVKNSVISGDFYQFTIGTIGVNGFAQFYDSSFNGSGMFIQTALASIGTPTPVTAAHFYTGYADGTLRLTTNETSNGIVSGSGSFFITANTNAADSRLDISAGIKQSTGLTAAALNGTYHVIQIGHSTNSASGGTARKEFISSGTGTYTSALLATSGTGTLNTPVLNSYAIAANGLLTMGGATGVISPDGSYFITGEYSGAAQNLTFQVGIKRSTGLSNATLQGEYIQTRVNANNTGAVTWVVRSLVFNGNGTGTTRDLYGGTSTGTFTYTVNTDGTLVSTSSTGVTRTGQVSQDGTITAAADTDWADGQINYSIAIKKQ